jgi:hypothetical protein
MASKGSLIEDLRYDVSSEEEEEEIKFNFKPKSAQSQKLKEELDKEVVFHFGQVATSKVWTTPRRISASDFEKEVIFNFKPTHQPQIQTTEAATEGNSEELDDDPNSTTSESDNNDGRQLWDEESNEENIYHILKKPHKGPEINNGSEESLMINLGPGSGRDNPARPRPINEERSWREDFEARVGNTINEMRLQVKNNRREVVEQLEVM